MVLIPKGSQIFDQLPGAFQSYFPSEQSMLDGKLASVLARGGGSTGADLLTKIQAETVTQGLQLVLREKATIAGDFLDVNMPKLVSFTKDQFGLDVPQGLFASVPFPSTILEDPLLNAMAGVGLNLALNAISAVPIVGKIIALVVNIGMALARLFGAQDDDPEVPPLLLPWTKYQRDPDEDLVNKGLMPTAGKVDWTHVWLPGLGGRWSFEHAGDQEGKEMPGARIYAPLVGKSVGWSKGTGLSAIPNTLRVAGPVQTIVDNRLRDLANTGDRAAKAAREKQLRYILRGDTSEEAEGNGVYNELLRPPTVIDTGAFFPAFAGIAGQLWQQVQQRGNPDMFKVQALAVRDAWQNYWGAFFSDGFALLNKALNSKSAEDEQGRWLWAALTPYICVVQQNGKSITLGMRGIDRPHAGPLVTQDIFTRGPGVIGLNTPSLYVELDDDQLEGPGDVAVKSWEGKIISPARLNGKVNGKFLRAVPWPLGEELMSVFRPPDQAIVTPACEALRRAQLRSLETTLVCAYVRPVEAKGPKGELLPAYGAFLADTELRDRCRDIREHLLTHDARFSVSLVDVDAVDPAFGVRLRKAGVGKPQAGLKKLSGGKAPPLVEHPSGKAELPIAPADGLPFDRRPVRVGRSRGPGRWAKGLAIGAGVAVVGAAGTALVMNRRTT